MQKIIFFLTLLFLISCTPKVQQTTDKQPEIKEEIPVLNPKDALKAIHGKWMLQAIKFFPQEEIIIPTKEYWVNFEAKKMQFNKEVNQCNTFFRLNGENMEISPQIACTKKCCDKDISDKLTYSDIQKYTLERGKLTLIASDRKFEFQKGAKTKD